MIAGYEFMFNYEEVQKEEQAREDAKELKRQKQIDEKKQKYSKEIAIFDSLDIYFTLKRFDHDNELSFFRVYQFFSTFF